MDPAIVVATLGFIGSLVSACIGAWAVVRQRRAGDPARTAVAGALDATNLAIDRLEGEVARLQREVAILRRGLDRARERAEKCERERADLEAALARALGP